MKPYSVSWEKPHVCSKCAKTFSLVGSLKTHKLILVKIFMPAKNVTRHSHKRHIWKHMKLFHTGKKPHTCSKCNKAFTQKIWNNMNESTQVKICSKCDKAFSLKADLTRHELIHTGYKPHVCSKCGKVFSLKADLKRHELINTGEKPHVCSKCDRTFVCKSSLQTRELFHTRKKPYACPKCN